MKYKILGYNILQIKSDIIAKKTMISPKFIISKHLKISVKIKKG
jgi:hypothetical protein